MRLSAIRGWCAAAAVSLALSGVPAPMLAVQAVDSGKPLTTAAQVSTAVNGMNVADLSEVDWIAAGVRALSAAEKNRLSHATLRKLDAAHAAIHSYSQTLSIEEGTVTANRISKSGASVMGATVAANGHANIKLWQDRPSSSSVLLQFTTESLSGALSAPVIYTFARPGNIKTNYDYYLKDNSGNRIEALVGSSTFRFIAPVPVSSFKVYRGSKVQDDDQEEDDPAVVTAFWEDVIDAIERAQRGDRVRVNTARRTTMPGDVLRALRGRSVTLALYPSSGDNIVINGKDLPSIPSSRDYYTMTSLRNLYDASGSSSSSKPSSSKPTLVEPPQPPPAPPAYQPPVYQPPPAGITPAAPPAPSSSAPASSSERAPVSSQQEQQPDREIEADEESAPPATPETEPEPEKPAVAEGSINRAFLLFVVLSVVAAATGASLLTLLVCNRRKK